MVVGERAREIEDDDSREKEPDSDVFHTVGTFRHQLLLGFESTAKAIPF